MKTTKDIEKWWKCDRSDCSRFPQDEEGVIIFNEHCTLCIHFKPVDFYDASEK